MEAKNKTLSLGGNAIVSLKLEKQYFYFPENPKRPINVLVSLYGTAIDYNWSDMFGPMSL